MGFLGQLFTAKNNYQAQGVPLSTIDYKGALGNNIGSTEGLVQALQQQMQGQGPNLAQTQLQSALNQENQQAAGLIGSQRGLNPQLAARQILQQQAQNTQATANQAAQLRQQQQLAAQQQLGSVLSGELGTLAGAQNAGNANAIQQNLGVSGINAGVAQQNTQAANNFFPGLLGGLGQAGVKVGSFLHDGGEVPAMVSPGEKVIPPGGNAEDGGIVPGQAPVKGDSPKNDIVPAMLKPGTIVVPRSVTQRLDPDAVKNFMAAVRGEPKGGYKKVAEAKARWKGGKL